jgi:outer membrane murein-binding lipoprotein Lpp
MMVLRIKEHEMTTPKTRVVEGVTYEQESESEHYGRRCDECVAAPFLSPLCDTLAPRFCHAIWQVAKPAATPALSVGEYAIQVEYLRGNRMNSFADTIESLVAKVAELSSQYGDEVSRTAQLLEECDALQLRCEAADRDADRYRLLKEIRGVSLITSFFGNGCINKTMSDVEETLDAAISKETP